MPRLRIQLRLRFTRLPNTGDERVFRDAMILSDVDDCGYEVLSGVVEKKLRFMEIPSTDFTIFFQESGSGDRVVVDDAYFALLVEQWMPQPEAKKPLRSTSITEGQLDGRFYGPVDDEAGAEDNATIDASATFEVEVKKSTSFEDGASFGFDSRSNSKDVLPLHPYSANHPIQTAPLTVKNLERMAAYPSATAAPSALLQTSSGMLNYGGGATGMSTSTSDANIQGSGGEVVRIPVGSLTCPPVSLQFYVRCVILALRFKTPKPGVTVTEMDLCDADRPADQITAVTFDSVVQKAIGESLRGDRRHVVELRNVQVRRKTEVDMRYQTNKHPLQLRLDRGAKVEVVQILTVPVNTTSANEGANSSGVVTIRGGGLAPSASGGVVDLSDLVGMHAAAQTSRQQQQQMPCSGSSHGGSNSYSPLPLPSSHSSSLLSGGGGPRHTTFSYTSGNAGASPAAVAGVVPSMLGGQLRTQQEVIVRRGAAGGGEAEDALPYEPGVPRVTRRDVYAQEPMAVRHAAREQLKKDRIRRRVEVSQECILCGLNCTPLARDDGSANSSVAELEAACIGKVRRLLEANGRNKGTQVPTMEELRAALSDRRTSGHQKQNSTSLAEKTKHRRLVCAKHFVNTTTNTVHVVHCRCAHLCQSYQAGESLEDVAANDLSTQYCSLCRLPGATVECYHPDCKEMYHVVCAQFSNGYVNFGKKDPYMPCAACPRHTLVDISNGKGTKAGLDVLHTDSTCWDDDVAFDSRVVEAGDLRDPDDDDDD